jgi:hypothetical protein
MVLQVNSSLLRQPNTNGVPCSGNLDTTRGYTISPTTLTPGMPADISVTWKYCSLANPFYPTGCAPFDIKSITDSLGSFTVAEKPAAPVVANPTDTVEIKANDALLNTTIDYGSSASIAWASTNTSACTILPGNWTGTSGKQSTGNLTQTTSYTISCDVIGQTYKIGGGVVVNVKPQIVKTIKSTFDLQGKSINKSINSKVKLTKLQADNYASLFSGTVQVDQNGLANMQITAVDICNTQLFVKPDGYLSQTKAMCFNTDAEVQFTQFLAGDFNGDDIINSLDFSLLNKSWNKADTTVDINSDGIINSIDFSYLNKNWNKSGAMLTAKVAL